MASRGRGRGMGIIPPPSPGVQEGEGSRVGDSKGDKVPLPGVPKSGSSTAQQAPPKTPSNIMELQKYLFSLNEKNLEKYGKVFGDMVVKYVGHSPEKRAGEVATLLYQTVTKSREHSTLGGKVCACIFNPDSDKDIRGVIRKELFRTCQGNYKQKNAIRAKSIEEWLALFSFVVELYHYVRVLGNLINALGTAIVEGMNFMLGSKDCTDDEVDCICTTFKAIGTILAKSNEQSERAVVDQLRTLAIKRSTSEAATCQIIELLEFRARGYSNPNKELTDFYIDAYTDAVARDELFLSGVED